MPIIPASWKAEIGRIKAVGQLRRKKKLSRPHLKK
jgi:predicted RNA polymerase sigma factor